MRQEFRVTGIPCTSRTNKQSQVYSCPPCSIYSLVSDLFVNPDFYVCLRSWVIRTKFNAIANFIQFNLAVIT